MNWLILYIAFVASNGMMTGSLLAEDKTGLASAFAVLTILWAYLVTKRAKLMALEAEGKAYLECIAMMEKGRRAH